MKVVLLFILLCITGVAEANPFFPKKKPICPVPISSMNPADFRITSIGAVALIQDKTGREWNVYIHSKKVTIDKSVINELIANPQNEVLKTAQEVFGAWICRYNSAIPEVHFEASSSYMFSPK